VVILVVNRQVGNVDTVRDHLTNIAQAVIGGLQRAGVEPKAAPGVRHDADQLAAEET